MRDMLPIRLPLAGTPAEEIFTRQRDDYSCGPACLTTVARLFGVEGDYDFFRAAASPDPKVGTPAPRMAGLCRELLPSYKSTGLDTYEGGVAIANIIQGEDHYVVFLKKEGECTLYYDPWEHELVIDRLDAIEWRSEKGTHDRWSAGFEPLPDNSIQKWIELGAVPKNSVPRATPTAPRP